MNAEHQMPDRKLREQALNYCRRPAVWLRIQGMAIGALLVASLGIANNVLPIYDRLSDWWYSDSFEVQSVLFIGTYGPSGEIEEFGVKTRRAVPHIGIGAIVLIHNDSRSEAQVKELQLEGSVFPDDIQDGILSGIVRDGVNVEEARREFLQKKPYRLLSWRAFPGAEGLSTTIAPSEEVLVKYEFSSPKGFGVSIFSGLEPGDSSEDWYGFGDGTREPKYIGQLPEPQLIFELSKSGDSWRPRLRADALEQLTVSLKVNDTAIEVNRDVIEFRSLPVEYWQETAREIYFRPELPARR